MTGARIRTFGKLVAINLALWLLLELIAFAILRQVEPPVDERDWQHQARLSFEGGLYVWDEHCLWTLQPGYEGGLDPEHRFWGDGPLRINSLGMRGPDVPAAKPEGVRRILILGGSHPMGMYVDYERTYAGRLQTALGPKWQVLNAAAPGHTSFQTREYLTHYGNMFSPDIVIADVGVNDTLPLTPEFPLPDHEVNRPPTWAADARSVLRHSNVYRLLRRWLTQNESPETTDATQRVPPEHRREHLAVMRALGKERGFTLVLINQFRADLRGTGRIQCLYRDADQPPPVVDACGMWEQRGDVRAWFADPIHANENGHELLFEHILETVQSVD